MELPGKIRVEQLKPVIAKALSGKGQRLNNMFRLSCNGNILRDSDTLFDAGAWDGSYLTIT